MIGAETAARRVYGAYRRGAQPEGVARLVFALADEVAAARAVAPRWNHALSMTAGTNTALAAGVMATLAAAGLDAPAMPGWWRTPRVELGGRSPEEAFPFSQGDVLDLARRDADGLRSDLTTERSTR